MKKIPKEILDTVDPARREEFKKIYQRQYHLNSAGFMIQLGICLFTIFCAALYLLFSFYPAIPRYFNTTLLWSVVVLAFILVFPTFIFTEKIRQKFNDRGVLFVHFFSIALGAVWLGALLLGLR